MNFILKIFHGLFKQFQQKIMKFYKKYIKIFINNLNYKFQQRKSYREISKKKFNKIYIFFLITFYLIILKCLYIFL